MCVKRPLLLLLLISAVWVPRSRADSFFSSCEDGVGNIFNATVVFTQESLSGMPGNGLSVGSEIAVYSSDPAYPNFCAGMMTWNGIVGSISIWGDDALTSVKDGLIAGEEFQFWIYDAASGTQYSGPTVSPSFLLGNNQYENDGIYILSSLQISSGTSTVSISLKEGWNLVGLDREVVDADYRVLFPFSVENTLFSFNGNYVQPSNTNLETGTGYWLRMAVDEIVELEGLPLENISPQLRSGWNLISGPACNVPLGEIGDPDGIIIENTLFSFNGSYTSAADIEQGKSYWIRTNSAGSVSLTCSTVASKRSTMRAVPQAATQPVLQPAFKAGTPVFQPAFKAGAPGFKPAFKAGTPGLQPQFPNMSGFSGAAISASIVVRDNVNETAIIIGVHPDASDDFENIFDLFAPPPPPVGAFDARSRIGAEDFLIDIRSDSPEQKIFTILYQPEMDQGSIVLHWDPVLLAAQGSFEIVDNINGTLFGPVDMTLVDSLDISTTGGLLDSGLRILVRSSVVFAPDQPELSVPADFALDVAMNSSLSWTPAERATGYHLQVARESDVTFDQPVLEEWTSEEVSSAIDRLDVSTSYLWRIRAQNAAGFGSWSIIRQFSTASVQNTPTESENELPGSVALDQNYPNPFNPTTTISFEIPAPEHVSLSIFDMTGRKVADLISRTLSSGRHEIRWDASGFSSGVYLYRLRAGAVIRTKTLLLMK